MNHKTQKQLLRTAIVLCIFISGSLAFGAGVAAFKEQPFHANASANVVAYVTLLIDKGPSIRVDTGNRVFTTDRTKLAGYVEVPSSIPRNITTESEMTALRQSLADLQNFQTRFPKSAPILSKNIETLNGHIKAFNEGGVRYNGQWLDKAQFVAIRRNEEEAIAAIERRKRDQKAEIENRAKTAAAELKRREAEEQAALQGKIAREAAEAKESARKKHEKDAQRLASEEEARRRFLGPKWNEYDLLIAKAKALQSKEEYLEAATTYRQALAIKSTKELEQIIHECEEKTSGL